MAKSNINTTATGIMAKADGKEYEIHTRNAQGRGRPSKCIKKGGKWIKLRDVKGIEYPRSVWTKKETVAVA